MKGQLLQTMNIKVFEHKGSGNPCSNVVVIVTLYIDDEISTFVRGKCDQRIQLKEKEK